VSNLGEQSSPRAFISHSSKDVLFARDTIKRLCDTVGFHGWLSATDLRSGADWERQIRESLRASQLFVLVMSPNAERSEWVQAETHWAIENMRGRVAPVMYQSCEPTNIHLRLGTLQFIDFRRDHALACDELVGLLRELDGTNQATIRAVEDPTTTVLRQPDPELVFWVEHPSQPNYELRVRMRGLLTIGRGPQADVRIMDDSVSRTQARLQVYEDSGQRALMITDANSANGTALNGVVLTQPSRIAVGDRINVGTTVMTLSGASSLSRGDD
jgi:hypothetical protein